MNIQYDRGADAMYLRLCNGQIAKTVKVGHVMVDIDSGGKTLGIEILDVSSQREMLDSVEAGVVGGISVNISEGTPTRG